MNGRIPTSTIRFTIEKVLRRIRNAVLIIKTFFNIETLRRTPAYTATIRGGEYPSINTARAYSPDTNEIHNDNLLLSGRFRPEFGRVACSTSLGAFSVRRVNRLGP